MEPIQQTTPTKGKKMKYITSLLALSSLALAGSLPTCNDLSYVEVDTGIINNIEAFNLSWAECELQKGEDEKAMSAYERVVLINPLNVDATLKLLQLYNKLHMQDEAKALRVSLENMQLSPTQRRILATLRESDIERLNFRAAIGFDMGYDSNVNFLPNSNIIGSQTAKSSVITDTSIDLDLKYDLFDKGGIGTITSLSVLQQSVYMDHQYDLIYSDIDVGLSYDAQSYSLAFPLTFSNVYYLNRNLLDQYGIDPTLTVALNASQLISVEFKYLFNRYIEASDTNRDVDIYGLGAGYYHLIGKDFFYLQGEYENYSAVDEKPQLFTTRSNYYVKAGVNYTYDDLFITRLDYQFVMANYDTPTSPTDATKRSDNLHNIVATITLPIGTNFNIESILSYYNNSSNYAPASYEKSSITAGINYNY